MTTDPPSREGAHPPVGAFGVGPVNRSLAALAASMAAQRDPDLVLDRLVHLLVPRLADFAIVYLIEAGALVRTAGVDHLGRMDMTYTGERFGLDGGSPLHAAIRTRRVDAMHNIEGALLKRLHPDIEVTAGLVDHEKLNALFVPLIGENDQVIGAALLGSASVLGPADQELVTALVGAAGRAHASAKQATFQLELNRALGAASTLRTMPQLEGFELAAFSLVEGEIAGHGGDWHDAFIRADGRLAFAVGDVVGHGLTGVTTMAQLRSGLRAYLFEGHDPGVALSRLNALACDLQGLALASVIAGVLDPATGEVTLARAGHPPAIVTGADIEIHEVARDPLVGVVSGHEYNAETVQLQPGQVLVLYTDGLVEGRDESIDVGVEQLAKRALTWAAEDAASLCDTLEEESRLDPERTDDTTVLAIGRRPEHPNRWVRSIGADLAQVSRVRQALLRHLRGVGVDGEVLVDIEIAAAELLANAVEASQEESPVVIAVAVDDYRVTLVVTNIGQPFTPPDVKSADPLRPRGRGLRMVREAAARFEVDHEDGATTVSCAFLRSAALEAST